MPEPKFARANDLPTEGFVSSAPLDLSDVVGAWFNTNRATGEIVRLDLIEHRDKLLLRVRGAGAPDPISWPEVVAIPYASDFQSRDVTGFEAHFDLGFMETHLAANIKYGVLVIQSYNRFKDGSGRPCYFVREFFHQEVSHDHTPRMTAADDDGPKMMMAGDAPRLRRSASNVDLSSLIGRWKSTRRDTKVICELELARKADSYVLHAFGAGAPRDWGEVTVTPHASNVDGQDATAFQATYDFTFMQLHLAANVNKGLLIIATYHTFCDGSNRSNYFAREFFYHVHR
jgi:hypothetical protein